MPPDKLYKRGVLDPFPQVNSSQALRVSELLLRSQRELLVQS